jgi:hypothetical protein
MTATCARLAASAMSVKSLRKASVEGALAARGAGRAAAAELGDCCDDEAEEKLETEFPLVLWAGEEMGASIMACVCVCLSERESCSQVVNAQASDGVRTDDEDV